MTLGRRLAFCMGSFANTLCDQARARMLFFYNHEAGLLPVYFHAAWFFYGLWNCINDPLLGQIIDRTKTRWGRRIPYIALGAVPLGVSFLLLWSPPDSIRAKRAAPPRELASQAVADPRPDAPAEAPAPAPALVQRPGRQWLLALYCFSMLFLFDLFFTMLILSYNALFTEMTRRSPRERSRLSGLREQFAVVALILALSLVDEFVAQFGWVGMGAIFGAVTAGGYLISLLGAREDVRSLPESPSLSFFESMRVTLANRSFRAFLGANLCKELVFIFPPATVRYYCEYVVPVEPMQLGAWTLSAPLLKGLLLGVPFILTLPCLSLGGFITPRIGVRAAWVVAFLSFIPGCLLLVGAKSYFLALLATCSMAPGLAGLMMLPHIMISEIIDEDAKQVGERREGAYYGVNGALVKIAIALHAVLTLFTFWATDYITPSDAVPRPVQPASAVWGVALLMGGVPALACLVGLGFLRYVRLPRRPDLESEVPTILSTP
jgi:GPH family glycoside/pentoside/hexuronide:cation symporter